MATVAALARQARDDARTKRGGLLLVDEGLRQEPLESTLFTGRDDERVVVGTIDDIPIGYALVGPLAAAAGTAAVLGGAAALLAAACLIPLAVPAIRAVRLP